MRLISWNINSVRARLGLVEQLVKKYNPDVLCLQETKVQDHQFPHGFFRDLGYDTAAIKGQKTHHGVATLTRLKVEDSFSINWCEKDDARHVAIKLTNGPTIHNFYVPAGGDEPNVETNDKFAHKIAFIEEMTEWSKALTAPSILVGDLNIAPHEDDVWDTKALANVVSHTKLEREKMFTLMKAHSWVDVMRQFKPLPQRLYSWWSYRARDWSAADKGRRLDHVWVSPQLREKPTHMDVLRDVRGWEKPSDHAPVLVEFKGI